MTAAGLDLGGTALAAGDAFGLSVGATGASSGEVTAASAPLALGAALGERSVRNATVLKAGTSSNSAVGSQDRPIKILPVSHDSPRVDTRSIRRRLARETFGS